MSQEEEKKVYFHIVKMTEQFRSEMKAMSTEAISENYQRWDLTLKLAIVQQLSVISAQLREIVDKSKAK